MKRVREIDTEWLEAPGVTEGAGAFRDLARLRGGASLEGGGPSPAGELAGAGLRLSVLDGRREGAARLGWAGAGWAQSRPLRGRGLALSGCTSRGPAVRWPRKGIAGPAPGCWQVGHSSSAPGSLLEEPCGPNGLRFPPAAPRSILELSPGWISGHPRLP